MTTKTETKKTAKTETKKTAKTETKKTDVEKIVSIIKAPRGVDQKLYEKALRIIEAGAKKGYTDDIVRAELLTAGVEFKILNKVFTNGQIDLQIIPNPVVVRNNIDAKIEEMKINLKSSREQLDKIAEKINQAVPDAKLSQIMTALRKYFKDNKIKFPAVIREKKGRMGDVNSAMVDAFAKNPEITKKEFHEVLKKVTKNADAYTAVYYKVCWALAHGKTSADAVKLN